MLKYIVVSLIFLFSLRSEIHAESVGYYKAFLTLIACQADDNQPEPVECHCSGTGKSGDGLGPCVCGDDCQCARKSTPVIVGPVNDITEILRESKPVEVKRDSKIDLLYFSTTGCTPCNQVAKEFKAMKRAGWKIGPEEDNHVILSNDYGRYGVTSFPCFILTVDGVPVKRSYGYMSRWQIAEFRKVQVAIQEPVGSMSVPGYRKPFEQATGIIRQMLGKEFKVNNYVSVSSPKRLEISVEESGGKLFVTFHGQKPEASAVGGWVDSNVNGVTIEKNRATVDLSGLLPDLTVEFE